MIFFLSDDKCVIIGSKRGEEMNQTVEYIKELTTIASPAGFSGDFGLFGRDSEVLVTSRFAQPKAVSM